MTTISSVPSRTLDQGTQETPARPIRRLTRTELEVLVLLAQGLSTSEAAMKLERAAKTVEWHRQAIGTKLGCSNRAQLTRIAIEEGLVPVRFRRTDEIRLEGDRVA